jgi:uncharacterized protein involved in exopolysaccharide biosynthesis
MRIFHLFRPSTVVKNRALSLVWQRKELFVLVSFLVFSGLSLAVLLWPRSYVSTAKVLINTAPAGLSAQGAFIAPGNHGFIATQVALFQSSVVAAKVGQTLRLNTNKLAVERYKKERSGVETFEQFYTELLKRGVTAKQAGDASVIEVSYSASDPAAAAQATNAFVKGYIELTREMRLDGIVSGYPMVLDEATLPFAPASPKVLQGFFLATVLAPLLGLLAVLLSEALDRRVRSRIDLEETTGVNVLCVVGTGRPSRTLAVLQTMFSFLTPGASRKG